MSLDFDSDARGGGRVVLICVNGKGIVTQYYKRKVALRVLSLFALKPILYRLEFKILQSLNFEERETANCQSRLNLISLFLLLLNKQFASLF